MRHIRQRRRDLDDERQLLPRLWIGAFLAGLCGALVIELFAWRFWRASPDVPSARHQNVTANQAAEVGTTGDGAVNRAPNASGANTTSTSHAGQAGTNAANQATATGSANQAGATGTRAGTTGNANDATPNDTTANDMNPADADLTNAPNVGSDEDADALSLVGVATLTPTGAATARGTVRFEATADGALRVTAQLVGAPFGDHGLHVHTSNRCYGADGKLAIGPHFNPFASLHGAPNARASHVGDLGNVSFTPEGVGTTEVYIENSYYPVEQRGGWGILRGKAVALTRNADDFNTQPDGLSGAPIACGIIQLPRR